MGFALVLQLALAAGPGLQAPVTSLVPYTELVERLPLRAADEAPKARVEPLLGRVHLTGAPGARLSSRLCPRSARAGGGVTLECRSRRIHAEVTKGEAGWVLELRQLRGLPFTSLAETALVPFNLASLALDESCPGRSHAAQGECAIGRGDLQAARSHFEAGRDEKMGKSLAAFRLGDLALLQGAPGEALAHYQEVGPQSVLFRIAESRICELGGRCLAEDQARRAYDLTGLPEAMAEDVRFRHARLDAYADRDGEVLEHLSGAADACRRRPALCQRLLLSTLRPGPAGVSALEAYLEASYRDEAALRLPLARAAAQVAQAHGVPRVAAMILSASTPAVPAAELSAHLLRTVELYWASGDRARAGAVLEFAQSRLPRGQRAGARWSKVTRSLGGTAFPAAPAAASKAPVQDTEALLARAAVAVSAASASEEAKR